jgi:hypothetical protein
VAVSRLLELRDVGLAERDQEDTIWFPDHPWQRDLRGEDLQLIQPYGYAWEDDGVLNRWVVPRDFIHDGASVPDLLRPVVQKRVLARVAVHHDRGYRTLGLPPPGEHEAWSVGRQEWTDALTELFPSHRTPWSRKDLDRLMGKMMREDEDGPSWLQRRWTWRAIRVGGYLAWKRQERQGPVS